MKNNPNRFPLRMPGVLLIPAAALVIDLVNRDKERERHAPLP